MLGIEMVIDEYDYSPYFVINKLSRPTYSVANSLSTNEVQNGANLLSSRRTETTIEVEVTLITDELNEGRTVLEINELLKSILPYDKLKRITFSDQMDRYYMGKLDGTSGIELVDENLGTMKLTFIVPDGLAISTSEIKATNLSSGDNPVDYITITNPGTVDIPLDMEVMFDSETGFFVIRNDTVQSKAIFGDLESIESGSTPKTKVVVNDNPMPAALSTWALNSGAVTPAVTPERLTVGAFSKGANEQFIYSSSYGTGKSWHGPAIVRTVPDTPTDFKSSWHYDFNSDGTTKADIPKQMGHISMTFADASGKIIVSVVIEDYQYGIEHGTMAIYVDDVRVYVSPSGTTYQVKGNQSSGATISVEKLDNQITVSSDYTGFRKTFTTTNGTAQLTSVTWYCAQNSTKPAIRNMVLRDFNIIKYNVATDGIGFNIGDKLTYKKDGIHIIAEVNNLQGLQLRDPASTTIWAPPGDSIFFIAYSSYSETPRVTLTGRPMLK